MVTGFFGKTHEGFITLLGRNGTDYSASVIANAIDADSLEIWKDVDGFVSADPKVVPGGAHRPAVLRERPNSHFGAKVLHPRTVEPARAKAITIRVKNVFKPDYEGTAINPKGVEGNRTIKSISSMPNMAMVKVYGAGLGSKSGVMSEMSTLLSEAGINVYSAATSQTCVSMLIEERDLKRAEKVMSEAKKGVVDRVETVRDVALLCLVGEGLGRRRALQGRCSASLPAAGPTSA